MKRFIYLIIIAVACLAGLNSCIEDGFTTSPADQPKFSVDTLNLGETFTLDPTPTAKFTVYNPYKKQLNISSITLRDDSDGLFRLNVDGISAQSFHNIEVRPNDSICVFVAAQLPANGTFEPKELRSYLDFVTNGVTRTVVLSVTGQDVERLKAVEITSDRRLTADRPYQVFDTLRIAKGATLTLEPGVKLRFHDGAAIKVEGRLIANGTAEKQIEFTGDRTGNVAASIPYELMSGQWGGVFFAPGSTGNEMAFVSLRNSTDGITLRDATKGLPATVKALTLYNCQVHNSAGYIIDSEYSNLEIMGCELTDASFGIMRLAGGSHRVDQATVANYYLFTAIGGPAVQFEHINADSDDESGEPYLTARFTNSIFYGLGKEFSHGDLTDTAVTVENSLIGSEGSDDDNFIHCIWGEDPLFYTVRADYHFDYRLQPDSPALGKSEAALNIKPLTTDRYGRAYETPAALGAYAFNPDVAPSPGRP